MNSYIEKGEQVFLKNCKRYPVVFENAEGVYLIDTEGKKYLDFVAGIAVNALGYDYEPLKDALKAQIDKFTHCSNLYWNVPMVEAADKLVKASGLDRVFFCNSGAEANESAFKLARKYAKKFYSEEKIEIISMKNSFHGRTMAAITATGQTKYQKGFDPLLPGVKFCEYNDLDMFKTLINDKTCAVILEIIQGEGGIISADTDFLKGVRDLCDKYNAVLIFDEVQTGIGRTGEIFAYQHYGIKPDICSLAKGLGAGIPIGAIIANEKVAQGFEPGDHQATFGGNPLACAAANIVLDAMMNGDILNNVKEMGAYLKDKLSKLKEEKTCIQELKGYGLMQGIALSGVDIPSVVQKCMDNGLLVASAGSNVVRFVPPLVIEKKHIDEAIEILKKCLD